MAVSSMDIPRAGKPESGGGAGCRGHRGIRATPDRVRLCRRRGVESGGSIRPGCPQSGASRPQDILTHAVATPHHLSTDAARRVLLGGGNAVDAAIAATATQGVVAPETCGIGGDLFALVHLGDGEQPRALNASGRAGSNADPELHRGLEGIPRNHPLSVTVPGCVDGWAALSAELGRLSLRECLSAAIEHATEGFTVSTEQAGACLKEATVYAGHPAIREFYPEGRPVVRGDLVKRPALAATLESIAELGRDAFYLGQPAEDIVEELGGLITRDDLARPHADWVSPISCPVGPIHRLDDPAQFTGLPRSRHAGGVRDAGPSPRSSRSGMVASAHRGVSLGGLGAGRPGR